MAHGGGHCRASVHVCRASYNFRSWSVVSEGSVAHPAPASGRALPNFAAEGSRDAAALVNVHVHQCMCIARSGGRQRLHQACRQPGRALRRRRRRRLPATHAARLPPGSPAAPGCPHLRPSPPCRQLTWEVRQIMACRSHPAACRATWLMLSEQRHARLPSPACLMSC